MTPLAEDRSRAAAPDADLARSRARGRRGQEADLSSVGGSDSALQLCPRHSSDRLRLRRAHERRQVPRSRAILEVAISLRGERNLERAVGAVPVVPTVSVAATCLAAVVARLDAVDLEGDDRCKRTRDARASELTNVLRSDLEAGEPGDTASERTACRGLDRAGIEHNDAILIGQNSYALRFPPLHNGAE